MRVIALCAALALAGCTNSPVSCDQAEAALYVAQMTGAYPEVVAQAMAAVDMLCLPDVLTDLPPARQ